MTDLDAWTFKEIKKPSFRIVEITDPAKLEDHLQYVNRVVEEKKALNIEKRPVSKIQAASTERLLAMSEAELEEYRNRPLPPKEKWQAEKDAEKVFAEHKADHQTMLSAESVRHTHNGNRIGDAVSEGASAFIHRKDQAVESFMKTKAEISSIETHFIRHGHLDFYEQEAKKKRPLWRRILDGRWIWKEEGYRPVSWRDINDRT